MSQKNFWTRPGLFQDCLDSRLQCKWNGIRICDYHRPQMQFLRLSESWQASKLSTWQAGKQKPASSWHLSGFIGQGRGKEVDLNSWAFKINTHFVVLGHRQINETLSTPDIFSRLFNFAYTFSMRSIKALTVTVVACSICISFFLLLFRFVLFAFCCDESFSWRLPLVDWKAHCVARSEWDPFFRT